MGRKKSTLVCLALRCVVCGTRSDSFIAHTKVPFITQRSTDLKFRARETKAPGLVFLKKSEITTFVVGKGAVSTPADACTSILYASINSSDHEDDF